MPGPKENLTSGASPKKDRRGTPQTLTICRKMLPLVRQIADDLATVQQQLADLKPEADQLNEWRQFLTWAQRSRRYQLLDEQRKLEKRLKETTAELRGLGLAYIDPVAGRIGFPTIVNGKRAFFSWQRGEEGIHFWSFPDEKRRRAIPASWFESEGLNIGLRT